MIRFVAIAFLAFAATPALAQGHLHDHGAAPAPASPASPSCTPEHAAMGHCKLAAPATEPKASGAAGVTQGSASCTAEHAAMGHCTLAPVPSGAAQPKPASNPNCTAEHAAMGHCTLAPVPSGAAQPKPAANPNCTAEHAAMGHCTLAPVPSDAARPKPEGKPASDPSCTAEHAAMGHCTPSEGPPRQGPSPTALSGPEHAADGIWGAGEMAPVRRAVYAEHGTFRGGKILIDRLEYRAVNGRDGYAWEGEGWYGGDYDRLWLKSEGEGDFGGALESAEVQALWSHAIGAWFNMQAGIRYDFRPRPDRAHLAIGVQGLAPYWFEVDAAAFLSDRGDLTARIEAEYDQRITNQLILQPRAEVNLSAQDVPAVHLGGGLSSVEAGLRLRYEFVPEFAPYIGVEHERKFGRTARFARALGETVSGWAFVTGLRAWF